MGRDQALADEAPRGFVPKADLYRALARIDALEEQLAFYKARGNGKGGGGARSYHRAERAPPDVGSPEMVARLSAHRPLGATLHEKIIAVMDVETEPLSTRQIAIAVGSESYIIAARMSELSKMGAVTKANDGRRGRKATWLRKRAA